MRTGQAVEQGNKLQRNVGKERLDNSQQRRDNIAPEAGSQ